MEKQKRKFPFQIHLAIGVIWIAIGAALMSGIASVLWILAGLLFIAIGLLSMKKKLKDKQNLEQ